MIRALLQKFERNPLERLLRREKAAGKSRFLLFWNRGLGDIPLGLYALVLRIREVIPGAKITFLTRKDLEEGFSMLKDVDVIVAKEFVRGQEITYEIDRERYDVVIKKPDPTRWLKWQLGNLIPKLQWNDAWDALAKRFDLQKEKSYIGVHFQTETSDYYGYEKNWPEERFVELFEKIGKERKDKIILFGLKKTPIKKFDHVIDLRGETSLLEMLSLIKNYCKSLIAPDSGILSTLYYLDRAFPLRCISFWSDPKQGILRQNVDSPNPLLKHISLIGENHDLSSITTQYVYDMLYLER